MFDIQLKPIHVLFSIVIIGCLKKKNIKNICKQMWLASQQLKSWWTFFLIKHNKQIKIFEIKEQQKTFKQKQLN